MGQKPIQKEHIAGRTGERAGLHVWQRLLGHIKLAISRLLMGIGSRVVPWQHFECTIGFCRIDKRNPACQSNWTARINGILMPRTARLGKTRNVDTDTNHLASALVRSHQPGNGIPQAWMLCQGHDARVVMRIGKQPMDEGHCIGAVALGNTFQALRERGIWTARLVRCQETMCQAIDRVGDPGL